MAGMHCCIKPQTLGLSAYFSQFNSNDVFFHHELKFAMALDFQVVSSKMLPFLSPSISLYSIFKHLILEITRVQTSSRQVVQMTHDVTGITVITGIKPKYTKSLITVTASLLTSLLTFCDQPGFMSRNLNLYNSVLLLK